MAISYTQDQYNTIKTVADKMGSGNENFKSAVNKKYGEGGYDSYLSYKAPVAPVNEGLKVNLDVTNQYRDKLGTGPALEHTTTPQPTPGTVSNISGGFSNLKEVAPIVTPKATGMEAVTGGIVGNAGVTGTTPITTPSIPTTTGATGYDTGAPVLDSELTQIQKDKNLKLEEQKKTYLLGKSQFEKNKSYYSNYDVLDKQYTGVVGDLITAGGDTGVVPEAKYQEIANKYGISLEEAKDPNSILKRGVLTDEGKKILGVSKAESDLEQSLINNQRQKDDLKVQLDDTMLKVDQQVEDLGKQMARNVGWTEAMGAWSGALRGSGYLQGIQNIKDDATTTINRLKAQAESIKTANAKDVSRLTEDFNKSYAFAKEDLDKQVNDLKTNNILKLNEAQATYGINSTKLKDVLDGINKEYGLKANESVSAYLKNLSAINSIAKENMSLIEESDKLADTKANKQFNEYLANGGANMMNANFDTLAQDVLSGKMTVEKAQSMKNIMLSSIQATLGKISPVSTQDLSTVNTLLSQGLSPSEVVAKMQSLAKFQPKATIDKTLDLGDRIRVQYSDGTTEDIKKGTEAMTEYQRAQMGKESTMTPYQQAQIDIENKKLGKVGATEFTGALVSPGVTQNRPDRNKNPGNVKIGDVGYGVDNQNHTIFGSEVDGYNAMIKDLTTKFTGGSRHVSKLTGKKLGPESTLADLGSVYAEDPKWASNLASRSGYSTTTQLKNIDINKLAPALAKIEGFTGTITEQQPQQGTTFKTDAIPQYEGYLKTGKIGENVATMEAIQKEFGSVENFRKQAEIYNNSENGPRRKELKKIEKIKDQVSSLLSEKNSEALSNSVGSVQFTASPWTARDKENFLGEIQNFLDGKTLQQLIDVKEEGATFGALSNEELRMLQNSASKLNQLAIRDDEKDPNRITGFNGSEENFKAKVKEMIDLYDEKIKQKNEQMKVGPPSEKVTPTTGEGTTTPPVGRWQSKK